MRTSFAITNARLVDPATEYDGPGGVLVEDGRIAQTGESLDLSGAETVIDAGGKILAPALIDLRAAKEPALTSDGETQSSLAAGAAAGGFGTVVLAPNETSPLDVAGGFAGMVRSLSQHGVRVHSAAAATHRLQGEAMAEIGLMAKAGAVYVGQGDHTIEDSRTLRRVMSYASQFDLWLALRPEDAHLSRHAVTTESDWSARMGLPAEPAIAERMAVDRYASIAALSGGKLMIDRLSTRDGLDALRAARQRDIEVAATAAIAHLSLNEVDAGGLDSAVRMLPPLRLEEDRRALIDAVARGEIDAIVSDHRPTPFDDKGEPFAMAIAGTMALETLLASLLALVHDDELSLVEALRPVTCGPADLLGLPQGRLQENAPADLVLIDGDKPWVCDPDTFQSPRGNSAWAGRRFMGRAIQTFVDGQAIYNYNG
ncbi:amidohydrolase family protein [Maricaulis sp.]|uniref:dihydroorotase n=1 Tax=Maricaulis sp. TaxID=1486257 RepID=UPI00262EC0AB|nr:amidohydrolase family protein [Maricaulis sp.]